MKTKGFGVDAAISHKMNKGKGMSANTSMWVHEQSKQGRSLRSLRSSRDSSAKTTSRRRLKGSKTRDDGDSSNIRKQEKRGGGKGKTKRKKNTGDVQLEAPELVMDDHSTGNENDYSNNRGVATRFSEYVEEQRAAHVASSAEKKRTIVQAINAYETLALSFGARFQLRLKWSVEKEIRRLHEELDRLESGKDQKAFEAKLVLYGEAYEKTGHDDAMDVVVPAAVAPGKERKRQQGFGTGTGSGSRATPTATATATMTTTTEAVLRDSFLHGTSAQKQVYDRESLHHELMCDIENKAPPMYVVQGDMCHRCNLPMIILASEALLGCPRCSQTRLYIQATSSRIAYGEEVEFVNFSYKRQNHFLEWLSTFQAKESTEVPGLIIDVVMAHLFERNHITDTALITQKKTREALKELKLRKYYDHAAQITSRITGVLPPRMTPFQAEQVKLMFSAIQGPFNIHCPPERTNFLSYGYCLYKFCELLGYDEFLPCFPLLKGKDKLACMDRIWKKICAELDWEFIESKYN